MRRLTIAAHAKVNLDLRILGIRPDGYHELETVFQALALHDTVEIVARPGPLAIECTTPGVPTGRTNLVWRAAALLWEAMGRVGDPEGASVVLEKRIPAEAGLGGGSADAAAALVGLDRWWGAGVGADGLGPIAAKVGADVPYFLMGGTCLGRGRGDALVRLPALPHAALVVVRPAFGVATSAAYRWFDDACQPTRSPGEWPAAPSAWRAALANAVNDLEAPVCERHPEIAALRDALEAGGAWFARMSGSGSTVFGLFDDPLRALAVAEALEVKGRTVIATATHDGPACRVVE